jgi:hypothetical protein
LRNGRKVKCVRKANKADHRMREKIQAHRKDEVRAEQTNPQDQDHRE